MNNKNKKYELVASALRVTRNFAPALTAAFQQIGWASPEFALLSNSILSVVGYYGDFANDKTLDFLKHFAENRERLVDDIVQSDKFKAVFIKAIGDNITESNERKRQLLKNYILNFACGVEADFNEHTKLLNTLNTITMEELAILKLWENDGLIQGSEKFENVARFTVGDMKRIIWDTRKPGESEVGDYEKYVMTLLENNDRANQILLSLGYKDLLYVLGTSNFGSGEEAKAKDITDFGKSFLAFIKE